MLDSNKLGVFDTQGWGLSEEAVMDLGGRLQRFWCRFRDCFKTKTRDTSENAWVYLQGLLIMGMKRNFVNIGRRIMGVDEDGQKLQQFMSDSPWSEQGVFVQIQEEIQSRPELRGGMLTLDESGDECAGIQKAGAARQYLGREGKVELGQVGVALGYYQKDIWTMVDAELYLPEVWFDDAHKDLRRRWHIPEKSTFATKPQMGMQMIRRVKANGLSFGVVGCDCLYGRDGHFRAELEKEKVIYVADIPVDTMVYLTEPEVGIRETPAGKKGRPFSQIEVLNEAEPVEVRSLVGHPDFVLKTVGIRFTERGYLSYECAARLVWTLTSDREVRREWLFIRQEQDGKVSFSLSNAPADVSLEQLTKWRCQRYFAERIFQDAKSESGWDELVARKYRAWMHHTAIDALALWFVAETKLDWSMKHPRSPQLQQELELEVLPALSMANMRELLQAVMPLKRLSPQEAMRLVSKHLVNRSRSTHSRLKAQRRNRGA